MKRTGKEYKETEFGLRTERAKNKADNRGKRNIFYMIAIRRYILGYILIDVLEDYYR